MTGPQTPPKFLNLLRIRMPVGAVTSFGHRLSGVILFISVPFGIYLLDLSVQGPQSFAQVARVWHSLPLRVLSVVVVWSLAHHLFAGLRFLLVDLEVGVERAWARRSAWIVNVAAMLILVAWIIGVLS